MSWFIDYSTNNQPYYTYSNNTTASSETSNTNNYYFGGRPYYSFTGQRYFRPIRLYYRTKKRNVWDNVEE